MNSVKDNKNNILHKKKFCQNTSSIDVWKDIRTIEYIEINWRADAHAQTEEISSSFKFFKHRQKGEERLP